MGKHEANHFKNFPTVDWAFGDFSVLPTFIPNHTLDDLKNCGKNARKSSDAVVKFASSKGLRMLSFVHDLQVCASQNSEDDVI